MQDITLSIIIVSWNVREFLTACLRTIPVNDQTEIIVVDSASIDGTVGMLRADYPYVKVLAQPENVGFTKGNNIGLEVARGRYILLLNPDTEIVGDALTQMVNYLDNHADVGIVGPHTLNTDRTTQSSRRRFPTLVTAMFESTWLQPYAPHQVLDWYYVRDIADTDTADVDWVQGSALMIRREVVQQIGVLDEGYIMFSEEMDWCRRTKDTGWRVVYLGAASIVHHGGKSTEQVAANKHIYFQHSKIRYFRKFHGAGAAALLRLFLLISYIQQLLLEMTKGLLGHRRDLRRERVRMYWQVIRALAIPGYSN